MTERTDYQASQPRGRFITDPTVRRWIYGIALAVGPILVAYGLLDEQSWPLWVTLVGAILVPGLAVVNTGRDVPTHGTQGKGGYVTGQ